ncbi:MAG: DNA primase small subunit domain-containing protein [Nanoarchaeota archaeon]
MNTLEYYSQKEIQQEIANSAKDREIGVMYGKDQFGKRPDVIQFASDILEFAKKGATSFHISEEHWHNPLNLATGMTMAKLNELRKGWDLILDIDTKSFELAKLTTILLIDALKFHDVKNFSVKFSGNKGFHIGVPFNAFPETVNGENTNLLFPAASRTMAAYLQEMIREPLIASILEKFSINDLAKATEKKAIEFVKEDKLDPFAIIDIDTLLISSRHMFRAPYSLNEKSNLVSVPIRPDEVADFDKESAKPENVKVKEHFLNFEPQEKEARNLIIQAFDWESKQQKREDLVPKKKATYEDLKDAIKEEYFPPCIKTILAGVKDDGRKRSLFVLLNFLKTVGWSKDEINKRIHEWNEKNYEPLKEGYIQAQLNWHARQAEKVLPANCDNTNYYKSLLICKPDNWCSKIKNPANYAMRKLRVLVKNKKT